MRIVIGNLAHVDAGKTTLSESMLYISGALRSQGRVDNKDTFLDTSYMEKARGITIFSKQANFNYKDVSFTLMDTPGHVDFSPMMERCLRVLDYGILVISGAEGIQCHTRTLVKLLERYHIPTFVFVNKMDRAIKGKEELLSELGECLGNVVDFTMEETGDFYEKIALSEENALEEYLETGRLANERISQLIKERCVFPCYFGSALKNEGTEELLDGIVKYASKSEPADKLSGYVYKISRDEQGNRLTHVKLLGGSLKVREMVGEEKITQIRRYSGERYETLSEVVAPDVCTLLGLENTKAGTAFGSDKLDIIPYVIPVLNYKMIINDETDPVILYSKLLVLEEEEPQLNAIYNEGLGEISIQVCGKVQMEILKQQLYDRFGIDADFGKGRILYRETISDSVMGVGHFEPLRHYAEIHVLIEPLDRGSGIVYKNNCSEDILDKNWQKVAMSCLMNKKHKGVLTGAPLTDVSITLLAGRAHKKHTEGGDFRQACMRAVRQGLMQAQSNILEPYYDYVLELPDGNIGRAINDIENMSGTFELLQGNAGFSTLTGRAPVATMSDYQGEVVAYTKGEGRLFLTYGGYEKCHNEEQVLFDNRYNPQADINNSPDSIFCAHGAGVVVSYDRVFEHMHIENTLKEKSQDYAEIQPVNVRKEFDESIGTQEIDAIIEKTFYANKREKGTLKNGVVKRKIEDMNLQAKNIRVPKKQDEYLLVDGYNIIYAWDELKELAKLNFDGARGKLLDILCNYQAVKKCNLIVVFDAYKVKGHTTEISAYHNINVVFTKEAQTADQYIERFAHDNRDKYNVSVATSDGLEQIIIRGQGCRLYSAKEFLEEITRANEDIRRRLDEYTN